MDELLIKMDKMSIDDKAYLSAYQRVVLQHPHMQSVLRSPAYSAPRPVLPPKPAPLPPRPIIAPQTYQQPVGQREPARLPSQQDAYLSARNAPPRRGPMAPVENRNVALHCQYCGRQGHVPSLCPEASAPINAGIIRSSNGFLVWQDG